MDIASVKKFILQHAPLLRLKKEDSRMRVYAHWEIILVSFAVLNLLTLGFSLYLFIQINRGDIFVLKQDQAISVETIERNKVKEIIASFELKQVLFDDRTVSPIQIADPSR